jgi:beta-phosphoglucomutase-like phosphatase (HAD superfamily)
VDPATLERFVEEERRAVTAHLAAVLRPDPAVTKSLTRLRRRFRLAVVSSSATARLDACFRATALDTLFPPALRFSAADSLPRPTSKPDPAVYVLAGDALAIEPDRGLAIEDSIAGVQSAVGAGFPTVGNLLYVAEAERETRAEGLRSAGASSVVRSWQELEELLDGELVSA